MKKAALALLMILLLPACEDDPIIVQTPTGPEVIEIPFTPNIFSGTWSGQMVAANGVGLSGVFLVIAFQEGVSGIGEWSAIGLIGVPGSTATFLIYRGRATVNLQPDNASLIGRWDIEVVDPDTDLVLCEDSAEFRGTLRSETTMRWASEAFTACNSLPGVAPVGVTVDWSKESVAGR